jgi:hypothetical protein
MKKIIIIISTVVVLFLASFSALGFTQPPAVPSVEAIQKVPDTGMPGTPAASNQIELNGVIVTLPDGWHAQTVNESGRTVIRLFYHQPGAWEGPWIELSTVTKSLDSRGAVPSINAGDGMRIRLFPGAAVGANGEAQDFAYIPGNNVMIRGGYQTAAQHDTIMNIVSNIQFANS